MEMNSGNKKRIILNLLKLLVTALALIAVTKTGLRVQEMKAGMRSLKSYINYEAVQLLERNDQISAVFSTYHN